MVVTSGISSATKVQQSYPACTVTVYVSGTLTLATIYSDNSNTPLSNPFSASSVGLWFFYAGNGRYDVKLSGGGIPSPFTLGDILLLDAAAGGGIVSSVTGSTGISVSPTSGAVVVTNTWGTPIPTQTTFPSPFPTFSNETGNTPWLGTRFQYGTAYAYNGQPDPAKALVVDLSVPVTATDARIAGDAITGRAVTYGQTGAVGVMCQGFMAVSSSQAWGCVAYVQPDISSNYIASVNSGVFFGIESDMNLYADASGNSQAQGIAYWAAGSGNMQTSGDSIAFALGSLGGVVSGNVSTNGTAVTYVSGTFFDASWPTQNSKIVINGVTYTISTVNNANSLTLSTSAGVQTNVAWHIGSLLPFDYGFRSYNGRANIGIRLGTLHDNNSVDLGGNAGVWPTDASQPIYFDNLNATVAQTSALSVSGGGTFQVNSPNGVQFLSNSLKQNFFFANGGIGITGDPNTAQTVESRFLSSGNSGNNYDARITATGGTNGTNGAGTLTIDANTVVGNSASGLDVRRYGAKCDGSTDDASAIQTAITAAGSGTVILPGVCIIGTGLSLNNQGVHLAGNPVASGVNSSGSQGSILRQKSGANLAYMVSLNSTLQGIRDLVIDGNAAGNASAHDAILLTAGGRADFENVTVYGAKRYGIYSHGSSSNLNCCVKVLNSMFTGAGSNNLYCDDASADWFITQSEFESAAGSGIELNTCLTFRIVNSDFGGNTLNGFYSHGTSGSVEHEIVGNQFGSNLQHAIYLQTDSGSTVSGNQIFGAAAMTTNTYDGIRIENANDTTVTGNHIYGNAGAGGAYKYGVEVVTGGAGNSITGNTFTGTFATAPTSLTSLVSTCNNTGSALAGTVNSRCYPASLIGEFPAVLASAPSSPNTGDHFYCTNCTTAANCTTSGSGHVAVWNGSAWTCQ